MGTLQMRRFFFLFSFSFRESRERTKFLIIRRLLLPNLKRVAAAASAHQFTAYIHNS